MANHGEHTSPVSIIQFADDEHSESSDDSIPELQHRVLDDTSDDDTVPELGHDDDSVDQQPDDCFDNFERYLEETRTASMTHINSLQWDDGDLYWDDDMDHDEEPYWASDAHKLEDFIRYVDQCMEEHNIMTKGSLDDHTRTT